MKKRSESLALSIKRSLESKLDTSNTTTASTSLGFYMPSTCTVSCSPAYKPSAPNVADLTITSKYNESILAKQSRLSSLKEPNLMQLD